MKRLLYIVFFICSFAQSQMLVNAYRFDEFLANGPDGYYGNSFSTTTPDATITQWDDLSGNGNHATTGVAPIYKVSTVTGNGQADFVFDKWLDVGAASAQSYTPGTDEWTWVFLMGDTVGTTGYLWSRAAAATETRNGVYFSTGELRVTIGGTVTGAGSLPAANGLVIVQVTTSAVNVWFDGTLVINAGSIGTGYVAQDVNLGARTDGSIIFDGWLEKVAIYGKLLSPSDFPNSQIN